jgi:hypothetical protein
MFANQYEEHLAHSAPCNSQWDGFDRGTVWADEKIEVITVIIGRMTNDAGQRVVIEEILCGEDTYHAVLVDGDRVFWEDNNRERAITVARWWMAGCPA